MLIAKLDRLSRNVAFVFALRDSGVGFVCADMPEANTLTIGVMATMAQHEREVISERTKRALAELKKQDMVLGTPENLTLEAIEKGREVRRHNARRDENNTRASNLASSIRISGQTWTAIATALKDYGFLTWRGKKASGCTGAAGGGTIPREPGDVASEKSYHKYSWFCMGPI